jgi:hypothetical protein
MNDAQFITYCLAMAATERCAMTPELLERLFRLAGDNDTADGFKGMAHRVIPGCHGLIAKLVPLAQARLAQLALDRAKLGQIRQLAATWAESTPETTE